MRNIKKILKTTTHKVLVYNADKKCEETIELNVTEVDKGFELPKGCVKISSQVTSTKTYAYTQTPQEFVKHATVTEVVAE